MENRVSRVVKSVKIRPKRTIKFLGKKHWDAIRNCIIKIAFEIKKCNIGGFIIVNNYEYNIYNRDGNWK